MGNNYVIGLLVIAYPMCDKNARTKFSIFNKIWMNKTKRCEHRIVIMRNWFRRIIFGKAIRYVFLNLLSGLIVIARQKATQNENCLINSVGLFHLLNEPDNRPAAVTETIVRKFKNVQRRTRTTISMLMMWRHTV